MRFGGDVKNGIYQPGFLRRGFNGFRSRFGQIVFTIFRIAATGLEVNFGDALARASPEICSLTLVASYTMERLSIAPKIIRLVILFLCFCWLPSFICRSFARCVL